MSTYGFEFRATAGFYGPDANDTYVLGETSAQTRNGITFHWDASPAVSIADVDALGGAIGGLNYGSPGVSPCIFNITLPASGNYDIRLAIGHWDSGGGTFATQKVVIKDNGNVVLTVGPIDATWKNFIDATGTLYARANWPGSNTPVNVHFATTTCTLELSATSGADYSTLAFLSLTQTAGATPLAPAVYGARYRPSFFRRKRVR